MAVRAITFIIICLLVLTGCANSTPTATSPSTTAVASAPASTATGGQPTTLSCPDASGPIAGAIVFVNEGDLTAVSADGTNVQELTTLPTSEWTQSPVWSPDGKILAYALNGQNPDETLSWLPLSMICGLDRATGKGSILAQGKTYESLTEPAWTSDGSAVYATLARHRLDANKQYLGTDTEIARYAIGTDTGATIAEGSSAAALSHDGKRLAYVFNNPETFEIQLMLANADGTNAQVIHGPGTGFGSVLGMNWSDDGTKLVFAASGGTAASQKPSTVQSMVDTLLGVRVALAHGAPMDVWAVDADGSNLERLTEKNYDDPRATWSPDMQSLALVTNTGGVVVIDLANGSERHLTELGDFGGITWAAR